MLDLQDISGINPPARGWPIGQRAATIALDAARTDRDPVEAITCFTPGTGIATHNGLKPVETLSVGDRVLTRDRGFQSVRWIGRREMSFAQFPAKPGVLPVLIRADALGPGTPARDMIVSPHHRVLTRDPRHLDSTGETEALIEASALVGQPGIMCVVPHQLSYIHVLFDQHEIILSDNMWSESFHLSPSAIAAFLKDQNTAIREIFPEICKVPQAAPHSLARLCLGMQELDLKSA